MTGSSPPERSQLSPWEALFVGRGTLFLKSFIILLVGAVTLYPSLNASWFGDDDVYFAHNTLLQDPHRIWKAWFQPGSFIEYYPIEQTVQWLQWKLWGLDSPFGYHLTNLILHLTSALLLWRLFDKLKLKWAWLGGLIFAIHPVVTDSVAVANELKNALSLPPFLLAMGFYLDFENSRKTRHYILALLFFLVAMLCKITMAFFPLIILLYAWWKRGRIGWADFKASIPFFLISLVLGVTTIESGIIYAQATHYHNPGTIYLGGLLDRFVLAGLCLNFYFGHFFLPLHQLPFYPLWALEPLTPALLLPWFAIALVLFCCWKKRHTWGRPVSVGLAFFALGLAPFIGLKEASYMCLTWVADHFLYIPCIGLIGLIVAGIEQAELQIPKRLFPVGIALLAFILGLMAYQTNSYAVRFADRSTFWSYTMQYNPNSWFVLYEQGLIDFQAGKQVEAIEHLRASTRVNPQFYNSELYLGLALCNGSMFLEGIDAFNQAIKDNPQGLLGHMYIGSALMQLGRAPEAIEHYEAALQIQPNSPDVRYSMSYPLEKEKRISDAIDQIELALKVYPDSDRLLQRLSDLQQEQQQPVHGSSPQAPAPSK